MGEDNRAKIAALGLDPEVVQRALQQGLYASVEDLVEDIFPRMPVEVLKAADNFTAMAANNSLQGQLLDRAWNHLISRRQALYSRDLPKKVRRKSNKASFLLYINGPMRNGVLIGHHGATAEFVLKKSGGSWVMYSGADWMQPVKNVAESVRWQPNWLIGVIERAVKNCITMPWFDLTLPVDISTVANEHVRKLLVRTPYCRYETKEIQTTTDQTV